MAKTPAASILCRTWEKDFLTMIGSQRRLSCKNGVLAFVFFFFLLSSFDVACHFIL